MISRWEAAKDRNRQFKYYRLTPAAKAVAREESKWNNWVAAISTPTDGTRRANCAKRLAGGGLTPPSPPWTNAILEAPSWPSGSKAASSRRTPRRLLFGANGGMHETLASLAKSRRNRVKPTRPKELSADLELEAEEQREAGVSAEEARDGGAARAGQSNRCRRKSAICGPGHGSRISGKTFAARFASCERMPDSRWSASLAGARHRRQRSDVQPGGWRASSAAPLFRPGSTGTADRILSHRRFPRLTAIEPDDGIRHLFR